MNSITAWARDPAHLYYLAGSAGIAAVTATALIVRKLRSTGRAKTISALVNIAAVMATSVQASGMWKFFGNTLGLPVGFRIVMFGFMEIALLASGLRARANVEEGGDAGIDGVFVWLLALASGLMSSTDASTAREGLFRVLVAVVVALLWTRDLLAAKRAAQKTITERKPRPIRWRITGERIFVWLRLADAVDTDIAKLDAARRVARFLRIKNREINGWRWPLTAKARADRERLRMVRDSLTQSDDSVGVYNTLASRSRTEAMNLLGIGPDQTGQPGPDGPGGKTSRTSPSPSGPDNRSGAGPDSRSGPTDKTGQADQTTPDRTPVRASGPDRTGPDQRTGGPARTSLSGPDQTGQSRQATLEQLEQVCRDWAEDNNVDPAHLSRRQVITAVRSAGFSCSTERAIAVQKLLDPKGATAELERELTGPVAADHRP